MSFSTLMFGLRQNWCSFYIFKKKNLKQKQNTMLLTISCQFVKMNTNRIRIGPNLMMYLAIIFTWATCSCFYNLVNMWVIFFRGMCYIAVLTEPITICNSFIWKPLPNTKMARELEQKWHHIIYVKKKDLSEINFHFIRYLCNEMCVS